MKIYMRVSAFIRICPRRDIGVLCCPSHMAWWSKHPISGDGLIPWQMWRTEYLVFWINNPLSGRVVLAGSSPQNARFLVHNWPLTLAEARADNNRSRVYSPQIPSIKRGAQLWSIPERRCYSRIWEG